jgi:hypothetical protein
MSYSGRTVCCDEPLMTKAATLSMPPPLPNHLLSQTRISTPTLTSCCNWATVRHTSSVNLIMGKTPCQANANALAVREGVFELFEPNVYLPVLRRG